MTNGSLTQLNESIVNVIHFSSRWIGAAIKGRWINNTRPLDVSDGPGKRSFCRPREMTTALKIFKTIFAHKSRYSTTYRTKRKHKLQKFGKKG